MKGREIRVRVIGIGKMGSCHIRNLAKRVSNARVVAVMDVDQANAIYCGMQWE
jgi:predicted dehydrogenase